MKYKMGTIDTFYSNNSSLLLSLLLELSSRRKTIVTYNKCFVDLSEDCITNVINISRHGKEYRGFLNFYRPI